MLVIEWACFVDEQIQVSIQSKVDLAHPLEVLLHQEIVQTWLLSCYLIKVSHILSLQLVLLIFCSRPILLKRLNPEILQDVTGLVRRLVLSIPVINFDLGLSPAESSTTDDAVQDCEDLL